MKHILYLLLIPIIISCSKEDLNTDSSSNIPSNSVEEVDSNIIIDSALLTSQMQGVWSNWIVIDTTEFSFFHVVTKDTRQPYAFNFKSDGSFYFSDYDGGWCGTGIFNWNGKWSYTDSNITVILDAYTIRDTKWYYEHRNQTLDSIQIINYSFLGDTLLLENEYLPSPSIKVLKHD